MVWVGFWCNSGAIGMERVDSVHSMDTCELTPSRGWTEITPIYTVFTSLAQFEVRRYLFNKPRFFLGFFMVILRTTSHVLCTLAYARIYHFH